MRDLLRRLPVLLAAVLVVACASATDRLEQGIELETAGQFEGAAYRYIDALDKDGTLAEARDRLLEVGDSAIAENLAQSGALSSRGRYVEATRPINRIDNLLSAARGVGVRLPVPADYTQVRRERFDAATESLLAAGDAAYEAGRWADAVQSYRQARGGFEVLAEQRDAALAGEADALLAWSAEELEAGRLQSAHGTASRIQGLDWAPPEVMREADGIMAEALARGEVEILALPVVAGARRRDPALLDLQLRTNEALLRNAWSAPPPFIALAEDRAVQSVVQEASVLGTRLRPAALSLLLRLVESDYGAFMEIVSVDATEYDVDQRTRNARTRDGQPTTFIVERGERRLRAEARVLLVDRDGNPLADVAVVGTGTGPFERGVYQGDPDQLNLDRREIDWFDRLVLEGQEQAIRQALAVDLAAQLAGAVFDPVLARIP